VLYCQSIAVILPSRPGNAIDRCYFTRADMMAARRMCDFENSVFLFQHFVHLNQTITERVIAEIRRAYEAPSNKKKKLSEAAFKRIVAIQRYAVLHPPCALRLAFLLQSATRRLSRAQVYPRQYHQHSAACAGVDDQSSVALAQVPAATSRVPARHARAGAFLLVFVVNWFAEST
jgi:hypothetical protein